MALDSDKIRRLLRASKVSTGGSRQKYITAYDPIIKRRVVHVIVDGWAVSLVTGHKFLYGG